MCDLLELSIFLLEIPIAIALFIIFFFSIKNKFRPWYAW
jgi:hypothetical protein